MLDSNRPKTVVMHDCTVAMVHFKKCDHVKKTVIASNHSTSANAILAIIF